MEIRSISLQTSWIKWNKRGGIKTREMSITYFDIIACVALRRRSNPPGFDTAPSVPVMAVNCSAC